MTNILKKAFNRINRIIKNWAGIRREYRITLEGIIFVLITFFIGFAAINTSTNLLYLIMSMMLSFFIISGLLSTSTLRKIRVRRLAVRHISAREAATIPLEVANDKRWMFSYSLRIMDYLATGEMVGVCYLSHIPPRSKTNITYRVFFPHRGIYKLARIRIVLRFPFGFFVRAIAVTQSQQILVYPQIIDIRPLLESANVDLGEFESGRKGSGHSLYGLREYTPSDSARFIHWKVSARSNKIMLREFEKEEKKKITLIFNNSAALPISKDIEELFENAVIYTASLAKYLIDREFQVQLETASGRVSFGIGISHLHRILRALAMINLEKKGLEIPNMKMDADSTNIMIHFIPGSNIPYQPESTQVIDITRFQFIPQLGDQIPYQDLNKNDA